MYLFFLIYIAIILYIIYPICKIVWYDLLDRDLTFLLCTNYLLLFLLSIIFDYQTNLLFSILTSLTLVIFSFLLVRKIKSTLGCYQLLSIPYFCFCVYLFSNILVLI